MNTPHTSDIPLKDIVDLILKINAQAYSIEAANPRHEHEWMVWQDVKLPDGKILIPGIISHSTNVVEHPELVAWRIKNYASVVGKENVIAGTDCGFSQGWNMIRVHPEVQWAKLRSLAEGAALASKDLWGSSTRGRLHHGLALQGAACTTRSRACWACSSSFRRSKRWRSWPAPATTSSSSTWSTRRSAWRPSTA